MLNLRFIKFIRTMIKSLKLLVNLLCRLLPFRHHLSIWNALGTKLWRAKINTSRRIWASTTHMLAWLNRPLTSSYWVLIDKISFADFFFNNNFVVRSYSWILRTVTHDVGLFFLLACIFTWSHSNVWTSQFFKVSVQFLINLNFLLISWSLFLIWNFEECGLFFWLIISFYNICFIAIIIVSHFFILSFT